MLLPKLQFPCEFISWC